MAARHVVVWMDHYRAVVIAFNVGAGRTETVESDREERQLHIKSGRPGPGHLTDDVEFFDDVVAAIGDGREVLITGPGLAKTAFVRHVEGHHPALADRIIGTEPLDHPSEGELLAFARGYFKRVDQLLGDQGAGLPGAH